MAKFEPKIEHFFTIVSSDNLAEELQNHVEYIQEILYYTSNEQRNSVMNAFASITNKKEVFRGLGTLMPLSSELIKTLIVKKCKQLKDDEVIEAYKWLNDVSMPLVNCIKLLKNYVNSNKILEPYETRNKTIQSTLNELHNKFAQLEEYNQRYTEQHDEVEKLKSEIAELEKEQQEGYWEQKKQELQEIKIQLERAKAKYEDDCKQLNELQKELNGYQSGTVSKNVSKYLKTLHSLSEELPKDEVN